MTREEAIKILKVRKDCNSDHCPSGEVCYKCDEAFDMAIKALKQEPSTDAVSRQAVLDLANDGTLTVNVEDGRKISRVLVCGANHWGGLYYPDEQEPKTGHWIQTNEFFINQDGQFIYKFICSECKSLSYFRTSNKKAIGANVCPNCGADMREGEAWNS